MINHERNAEWRAERVFQTNGVRLWLGVWRHDRFAVAEPTNFVMHTHQDGELLGDPTVELDHSATQSLMDELWAAGVRPTGKAHPSEVIQAKDAHLADLRKALFEGIAGPGHP